jgi:hypothetical protein
VLVPHYLMTVLIRVSQETFIANVTTQVVERDNVRSPEKIFSLISVNRLSDVEVEAIASEPASAKRQREFLEDRIKKLDNRHTIFRGVIRSGAL